MNIITFPQWINKHKIQFGKIGTLPTYPKDLPPIILNPLFADLYNDEYAGYITLTKFLEDITEETSEHHYEIIRQLSDRGITTEGVGGGDISNDLYKYMNQKKLDNPINEYLVPEKVSIRHLNNLFWRGWVFPAHMFVFIDSKNKPLSINWPTNNPMEVK